MLVKKVMLFLLLIKSLTGNMEEYNYCPNSFNFKHQNISNISQHFEFEKLYQFESAYPTDLQLHPFYPYFYEPDGSRNTLCHGIELRYFNDIMYDIIQPAIYLLMNCTRGMDLLFRLMNITIDNNGIKCNYIDLFHYYAGFEKYTYVANDILAFYLLINQNRIAIQICFRSISDQLLNSMWVFVNHKNLISHKKWFVLLIVYIFISIVTQIIVFIGIWFQSKNYRNNKEIYRLYIN